jgi:LemA protein
MGNSGIYITLAVIGLPLIIAIAMYNGLVAKRNGVANVYGTLDAMLQKRYDLVPNLVATVKGYATHERELLERVIQLRGEAQSGATLQDRAAASEGLSAALGQVIGLAEAYPELKASANFLHLQASLNEIEEQISAARRAFNAAVTDYNNAVETFPSSIIAGMFGFTKNDWFQIADAQRQNPNLAGSF